MSDLTKARNEINLIDKEMAELFERRMKAVEAVAAHKRSVGMPIHDEKREREVIARNCEYISDPVIREYYVNFINETMKLSSSYQTILNKKAQGNAVTVCLGDNSYTVHVGKGLLNEAEKLFNLDRKVLIVTDDGVPAEYSKIIAKQCKEAYIVTVPQGEGSKSINGFSLLLSEMLKNGFTRSDCAVAVGGGVVGDLTGFAASSYMRGIDFYNVPTTVLSQVDSSVGGKTGINFGGVKNSVGAFKQPKGVIVDVDTLSTLPDRQISNGLCEAVKMAATLDSELFEIFENSSPTSHLEEIITKSIMIKASVVEQDEKEAGLRRVLNFGHTVGHGIESLSLGYYHGECVSLGMIPMCGEEAKKRLIPVLKKLNLPTEADYDTDKAFEAVSHDKKSTSSGINAVFCDKIGTYTVKKVTLNELKELVRKS